MKKIISVYLILSIIIFSCTNLTHVKRNPIPTVYLDKINSLGQDHESEVLLMGGEEIKAEKILIVNDTLHMTINESLKLQKAPLVEVEWIKIKDSKLGLGYGFFIGAGIGTIVGFGIGEGEEMGGLAVLGGIVIGGFLGGVLGYILGGSHGYQFEDNNK